MSIRIDLKTSRKINSCITGETGMFLQEWRDLDWEQEDMVAVGMLAA
jgi:hypothetical protein